MILINKEKCIGCGLCAFDCSVGAITMDKESPQVAMNKCFACGHCISVCPVNAITMSNYDANEVIPYNKESFQVDGENLLNFMKFRRSIRHYKPEQIKPEQLHNIIEAGRYTPTGSNRQPLRYIVLQKDIVKIKELAMKGLHDLAINHPDAEPMKTTPRYRDRFISMYQDYLATQKDTLLFDAPTFLVIVGDRSLGGNVDVDGGLAASNMELMAFAQGLGACYIGFFTSASELIPEIRKELGLKDTEKIVTTLVLGYPDIQYHRTTNRKDALVEIR